MWRNCSCALRGDVLAGLQEFERLREKVVEVHRIRLSLPALVGDLHVLDLLRLRG